MQEEALHAFRNAGNKRGVASTLNNLGNLLDELGDLSGASHCYEQAYALHQETGYRRGVAFVLTGWGVVLLEQDQLAEARSKLEEALAIRKELADQAKLGESHLLLAQLALEENRPTDAQKLAREAAQQFALDKSVELETAAYATLTRSLLAERKIPEAGIAADRALAASRKTSYVSPHLEAEVVSALVLAARGKLPEADKQLGMVEVHAKRYGFVGYEFTGRLERGKIRMKAGQIDAGKALLSSLQSDSRAKGFILIARKAAAALQEAKAKA